MSYKIAMLLKPAVAEYCAAQFPEPGEDVMLRYFTYRTMEEFEELCLQIGEGYDGVVTSGLLPDTVLSKHESTRNMCRSHLSFDTENTYRLILCVLLQHPELSISQIELDHFYLEQPLDDIILNNRLASVAEQMEQKMQWISSYEDMEREEIRIAEDHLQAFREGRIKYVLSASLLATERLEQAGCPCSYIFPSPTMIRHVIDEICRAIDLKRARGSLPAIIRISLCAPRAGEDTYERAQNIIALKKRLTEFAQTACQELTLKTGTDSFEFYTDRDTLERLTSHFSHCPLTGFLSGFMREELSIGYGIGATFYQARTNAVSAGGYSENSGTKPGARFLIDDSSRLFRLSESKSDQESDLFPLPAGYMKELSYQVKLSPKTLFKIAEVLRSEGTNEISSAELINRLGVSLRTANHYLSNLAAYGKAEIVGQKRQSGRGPHINIYKIDMPYR